MKGKVLEALRTHRIIAIARGIASGQTAMAARALYDGGVRLMEVTFDQLAADGTAQTRKAIEAVNAAMGDSMIVGAGTVLTPEQAKAAAEAGARYIVMPNVSPAVIEAAGELGMAAIPGALTPTEIVSASEAGADAVKLFPAGCLGPGYLKAVRAPLPHIPIIAVGNIDLGNIAEFLKSGAIGAGVGGSLVSTANVSAGNWAAISETARRFCEAAGAVQVRTD